MIEFFFKTSSDKPFFLFKTQAVSCFSSIIIIIVLS